MTKKEIKKQKIKMIIKKIIDILCYIGTFLFILILVIVGVQSCQKKPQNVSAEEEVTLRMPKKLGISLGGGYYTLRYKKPTDNVFGINLTDQQSWLDIKYNGSVSVYESVSSTQVASVDAEINEPSYIIYDNVSYQISRFNVHFKAYERIQDGLYYLRMDYFSLNYLDSNGSNHGVYICQKSYTSAESTAYESADNEQYKLIATKELFDYPFTQYFYDKNEISNFVFNKQFNYNAPLGTTLNGLYGDASFDSSGQNMRYKLYDVGYFVSNGMVFNQIKYWAIQSDGNMVYGNTSTGANGIIAAPSGHWIYSFIYYVNTESSTEVLVNYHNTQPYSTSGGGTSLYYDNSSTWINDQFRYISFLTPLSDSMSISINAFNNNNQNSYTGYVGSVDVADVFTLVASAFTAWIPIMDLTILPGITLGILLFTPLVAMLVFAIIRIIKK